MSELKKSYFCIRIKKPEFNGLISKKEIDQKIDLNLDLLLAAASVGNRFYKFKGRNENLIYMFSTENRKRKGQINKLAERYLNDFVEDFTTEAMLKDEFERRIDELKVSSKLLYKPPKFNGYIGKDLKVFDNKETWYIWQKEISQMLFNQNGNIKEADPRQIICLYDKNGNSGKSSFFKYLYFKYSEEIGRISYGSASQLRSSLINIGPKLIYIIDLPRTPGKGDNPYDILAAVEELKTGLIISSMYGSGSNLMMDVPHIIISSNFTFDITGLSQDRWIILEIDKKRGLKNITKEVIEEQKRIERGNIVRKK